MNWLRGAPLRRLNSESGDMGSTYFLRRVIVKNDSRQLRFDLFESCNALFNDIQETWISWVNIVEPAAGAVGIPRRPGLGILR